MVYHLIVNSFLAANCSVRMNTRRGDDDGDSPPTDKESEDDDGNRWWLRSSDSLILLALLFESDALINGVTLKKQNMRREQKRKTERTEFPGLA